MHNPANGVVDQFGFRERLMAAFVANDPKSGGKEACPEAVETPEDKTHKGVCGGMREGNNCGINESIQVCSRLVCEAYNEAIPDASSVCVSSVNSTTKNEQTNM